MIKQGVILAAGRGSRLGALTSDRTKAMLPVLGKPIMVRVMDRMREAGITRFVVVIGAQEGSLASYLSSSWYPNTEVEYVLQPVPKGTADALALAAKYIEDDFLLASVDNLTPPDHIPMMMDQFHEMETDFLLSLVRAGSEEIRTSAEVVVEGTQVTEIVEKPVEPRSNMAAFMVYACKRRFLEYLDEVKTSSRGEKELASAIQMLIADGGHVGYVVADQRQHLSVERDLLMVNRSYLDEGRDCHILSEIPGTVAIIPPIRIDPGVNVGRNAQIGPYVYLESGCTIGEGATISNAVVLRNTAIGKGEVCENQIAMRSNRILV